MSAGVERQAKVRTTWTAGRGVVMAGMLAALALGASALGAQEARPSFYEPGISPDGDEIAFVHGGDIWTVPTSGGDARLLIAHEEEESRPMYSPDGRWLAFESYRDGTSHIHLHDLETGETRQLTFMSTSTWLDGWSADSEWIWFSSVSHDIAGMSDIFRVRIDGGTPMPVFADRYAGEFWAAPHADGRVAMSTRGRTAWSQWWRNGHSHMDEAEIWIGDPEGEMPSYTRVTTGGKNQWPMWTPAADLAFVSDRSGSENLWRTPESGGTPRRLTDFSEGRVLWPTISSTGVIAFERDFRIWTHDLASGATAPVAIRPVGAVQGPRVETETMASFSGFTVSPDGEKLVVVARGDLFAGAAAEGEAGSLTSRVTRTPAPESDVRWAHDSRHIAYASDRDGSSDLWLHDFATGTGRPLTSGDGLDAAPSWAPDDLRLAYIRDGRELRVHDVASGEERTVAEGLLGFGSFSRFGSPEWSPDGRWIAFMATPDGEFWNVHVVPADGSAEARAVSFLPNTFGGAIAWHPDGRSLFYTTTQRTEDTRVVRVDLVPRTPVFREDALAELFRVEDEPTGDEDSAQAAGDAGTADDSAPVEIDFDGVRRRYQVVPIPFSANEIAISPDGDELVVTGSAAGQQNLYTLALDPLDDGPSGVQPITSGPGSKGGIEFADDSDRVWYLQGGRVRSVGLDGNGARTVSLSAELEVDFHAEKDDVFLANWSTLDQGFYDPDHHGADWAGVRDAWRPVVAGSANRQEMRRALLLMTGELDASHTGVSGSEAPDTPPVGRLGLRFDRRAYETEGAFVVTEVLHLGPAHVSGEIAVGDRLVRLGDTTLGEATNLNRLLRETVGDRVEVGVRSPDGEERAVALAPVSLGAEKNLLYRSWVEGRRQYVAEVSDGRLGYVHIPDMGGATLNQLYLDLDQENRMREGIVVDVRNNNGGFVNNYALDVFSRRSFMTMQPRGGAEASSRHQLGQRAYLDPVILVTNQNTLSDGEDFTEGWRSLGIGEVVGEPTAGWIIYTSNRSLFDGTRIRLPFIGIRGADGEIMERVPRSVDLEVERPSGEWYTGRDAQLDAAVERLLARIDGGG